MHRGADRLPGWGANGWGHGDTTNWGARELLGASGACGGDTLGEESSRDGVNGKNLGGAACRGELQLGQGHWAPQAPGDAGLCQGTPAGRSVPWAVALELAKAGGGRGHWGSAGPLRDVHWGEEGTCLPGERVGSWGHWSTPAGPGLCEGAES